MAAKPRAHKHPSRDDAPATPRRRGPALAGRWVLLVLVAIYALGVWARYEDYPQWRENRAEFFFHDEPVLANGDGYYYLRYARDLAEGTYDAVDAKRRVPDEPPRPSPPPLLSALTSALHGVLGTSLDRIAVFLPLLLAPLVILPLFALARAAAGGGGRGTVMGLAAALLAVTSEYYVGRTRIGVYDTDCLIVPLTLAVCYLVYRFATEQSRARYLYAAAAAAGYLIFYLWWDTATMVVSAICLPMFAVALALFYRARRGEVLVFAAAVAAAFAFVLVWRGPDAPLALVRGVTGMLAFVGGEEVAGPFPETVGNIRELQVLPFAQMAQLAAGHALVFLLGAAGVVWWLIRLGRRALLVVMPVLLAVLPMMFGNRFLIFTAPVIALGVGYLLERAWAMRSRWPLVRIAVPVLAIIPAAVCYSQATARLYRSPMARSLQGIEAVAANTPENAVVWSTFWNGYPVLYYARRATITDAGTLEGPRLVYQNVPLAARDQRLAANFIQFWTARGSDGMETLTGACGGDPGAALRLVKAVCRSGPEDGRAVVERAIDAGDLAVSAPLVSADEWLRFFFPPRRSPLFLLLSYDLAEATVWFERGTWDPSKRSGVSANVSPYYGVRRSGERLVGSRGLMLDLDAGILRDGTGMSTRLSRIVTVTAEGLDADDLGVDTGVSFEWVPNRRFGVAMSEPLAASVFNQLFIRHRPDGRYFRPVSLETPSHQLWEVRGDGL